MLLYSQTRFNLYDKELREMFGEYSGELCCDQNQFNMALINI